MQPLPHGAIQVSDQRVLQWVRLLVGLGHIRVQMVAARVVSAHTFRLLGSRVNECR